MQSTQAFLALVGSADWVIWVRHQMLVQAGCHNLQLTLIEQIFQNSRHFSENGVVFMIVPQNAVFDEF